MKNVKNRLIMLGAVAALLIALTILVGPDKAVEMLKAIFAMTSEAGT
ncbi:MAG: hypothetical protein ACE5GS_06825 [Kiloniellaceae bacterium]